MSSAVAAPGLAVRARGLVKRYGEVAAVDHIDLDIPVGGCFGILGPNGAGKTTLMRMITCVSPVSEGRLEVLGADVGGDRRALKRHLGVVPQSDTLDYDLSVRDNLLSFAGYHDVPRREAGERADALLGFTQLADRATDRADELSGGMQRRLAIARALVNNPDLVVLDEPTTGLDPQARHLVWDRLRALIRQGKTLLLTTHYMDEAAQLCYRIAVLDQGKVIAQGAPRELIAQAVPPRVVEVAGGPDGLQHEDEQAIRRALEADPATRDAEVDHVGDRVLIGTRDANAVTRALAAAALDGRGVTARDATLEDVFLRLTGRALVD